MNFSKLINSILGSLLVAFGLYMIVGLAMNQPSGVLFLIGWVLFGYWFYKQETIKHIWRKSFIFFAIESFLMPIAGFFFSVLFIANETEGIAEGIGGAIGGGLVTAFLGFIGFFLGIVFLLIGLLVFKVPKEVKVVNEKPIKVKTSDK